MRYVGGSASTKVIHLGRNGGIVQHRAHWYGQTTIDICALRAAA